MKYFLSILFFCLSVCHSQLLYKFDEIARNTHYGTARDIAIDSNGTIFLINDEHLRIFNYEDSILILRSDYSFEHETPIKVTVTSDGIIFLAGQDGLYAYNYDESLTLIDYALYEDGYPKAITTNKNGKVFLATGSGGLYAFNFDGSNLIKTAHIDSGGYAVDVVVYNDSTIILANEDDGLRVYTYNGISFFDLAHIPIDSGYTAEIEMNDDGIIFVVNSMWNGNDNLIAYVFDGFDFTNIANLQLDDNDARVLSLSKDGDILLYQDKKALFAYSFNDSFFTKTAQIDIEEFVYGISVNNEDVVFLANAVDGLRAYDYYGSSFTNTAHFSNGTARNVVLADDGTVFLDNGEDGLRAYTFDGESLNNTAHFDLEKDIMGLTITADNSIVFAAHDSLFAYFYDGNNFTNTAMTAIKGESGYVEDIEVNSDNMVFLVSSIGGLLAYNYDGVSFNNTAHFNQSSSNHDLAIVNDSTIYMLGDSIWVLNYDGISFIRVAAIKSNDFSRIAVGIDGTVYASNYDSLYAFSFDGFNFLKLAQIQTELHVGEIRVSSDNHIFVTTFGYSSSGPLYAYGFNGESFYKTAENERGGVDIALGMDGIVYLAGSTSGRRWRPGPLIAYRYSFFTSINETAISSIQGFALKQNFPNPFNPNTTIEYQLNKTNNVDLSIYNILGQKVSTLVQKTQQAGSYKVNWNSNGVTSGVYFYTLKTSDGFEETKKLVVIK
ncbi:MAG: T9SS C-terminal target domain-containing protein [Calditrichaeota bacterium]|nr:MAG: T9SS C-terminal target domain-containing protein [Calditrichota bacterium]MBL1204127.1 T9SS C-terminal target domain-containing protein [Calditrichota bacterium]NOG43958.1 T9SS type A sorting domain-containing protein [Calditrichota bacterium]